MSVRLRYMVIMSGVEQIACKRPKSAECGLELLSASRSLTAVIGSMYRSETRFPKKVGWTRWSSVFSMPSFSRNSRTLSVASSSPTMVVWWAKKVESRKSISPSREETVSVAMVARTWERSTASLPSLE